MSKTPVTSSRAPVPRIVWPIIALALVLGFNLLFTHGFCQIEVRDGRLYGSLIDIIDRAGPVMLVSIGMTLVIATAGIDLSVGAVMAIAGAVAAGLVAQPDYSVLSNFDVGGSFVIAAVAALLISAIAGAGNGTLVAICGVQPIVATLILMVAGRGVAQLLTSGQIITFENESFAYLGNGFLLALPVTVSIVLVVFIIVSLLTRKTALGLFVEAVGGNPVASRHAGLRSGAVKIAVYTVCGLLAGLAGLIAAADIKAADANNAGLYIELDAILAVVIGGTALTGGRFSLAGSIIGALLIQALTTTILSRGVPVEYTLVVKGAVVIAVCLLQAERFRSMFLHVVRRRT
ncbi:MAG: ABC transporter permease [Phycisphaerales bacterium]|nr:ABC transporter permease [Phycisphaerales bacterium]